MKTIVLTGDDRTKIPWLDVLPEKKVTDIPDIDPNDCRENDCREYARIKVSVPVEIQTDESDSPVRTATADLSLGGCYIETIFPLPIGTDLDLQLSIETTVLIAATVATCDPQVGNGIKFIKMLSEDRDALAAFLDATRQAQDLNSRGTGAKAVSFAATS